jgi:DNA-binding transcriptional LysR family regulator
VTEVGQDVYRHARAALAETEAIEEAVARLKADPQGLVRVSCPLDAERLLGAALPRLLAKYPQLRIQLIVTNRRVDLIEEGIDVAIRVRENLDTDADLQVKIIGRAGSILVASPALVIAHGRPVGPANVAAFPTISYTDRPGLDRWTLVNAADKEALVMHEPRLSASAFPVLRQAAIDGIGIALLPETTCREALESGQLVRILPEWSSRQGVIHLVFTSRQRSCIRILRLGKTSTADCGGTALNWRRTRTSAVRNGPLANARDGLYLVLSQIWPTDPPGVRLPATVSAASI